MRTVTLIGDPPHKKHDDRWDTLFPPEAPEPVEKQAPMRTVTLIGDPPHKKHDDRWETLFPSTEARFPELIGRTRVAKALVAFPGVDALDAANEINALQPRKLVDQLDAHFLGELAKVGTAVHRTIETMARTSEVTDLISSWSQGDFHEWDHRLSRAARTLRVTAPHLAGALQDAFVVGSYVPSSASLRPAGWNPEAITPQAVRWASERSGALVVGISDDMEANIRRYVTQTVAGDIDVAELKRTLAYVTKLDPKSVVAVERYRLSLLKAGQLHRDASRMAREYGERLLKGRADAIAQTETMTALNAGMKGYWSAMVTEAQIPSAVVRWSWVNDIEPCPVCRQMQGVTVGGDENFDVPGVGVISFPPAHPRCHCTMRLAPIDVQTLADWMATR